MPRPPSENTVSIAMRIPAEWDALAHELADDVSRLSGSFAHTTKTEMLRHALGIGLEQLSKMLKSATYGKPKRWPKRGSARASKK